jgi:hypothetical protein
MLGSKASDVEVRSLSDRKAAGEGSIIDCICDTYFQIILGMRATQDTLPQHLNHIERIY